MSEIYLSPGGDLITSQFWRSLSLGVLGFLGAWLLFDRYARDNPESGQERNALPTRKSFFHFFGANRAWGRPLTWLGFHFQLGGWRYFCLKITGWLLLLSLIFYFKGVSYNKSFAWAHIDFHQVGQMLMSLSLIILVFEMMLLLNRIFNEERKWKTLGTLLTLPYSPSQIAWTKVGACFLSLGPTLFFIGLSITFIHQTHYNYFFRDLDEPGFWFVISLVIIFWHIVVYMALQDTKSAGVAVLLGIGLFYWIVAYLYFEAFNNRDEESFFVMMTFFNVAGCLYSWKMISRRLIVVGSQS